MKLKDACDIGYACGLETVDEAILNIQLHLSSLFSYYDAAFEFDELNMEYKPYKNKNVKIKELFPDLED